MQCVHTMSLDGDGDGDSCGRVDVDMWAPLSLLSKACVLIFIRTLVHLHIGMSL